MNASHGVRVASDRPRAGLLPPAAIVGAAALLAALAPTADVLGLIASLTAALLVALLAWRTPSVAPALLTGFAVRLALILSHWYLFPLPGSDADASRFDRWATQWASGGLDAVLQQFSTGSGLFVWVMAVLYAALGNSLLLVLALNTLLGSILIWQVHQLARALWGDEAARAAAWVTALFPTLLLYSAMALREMPTTVFAMMGAHALVRWKQTSGLGWIAMALVGFALSTAFHSGMIAVFGVLALVVGGEWWRGIRQNRALPFLAGTAAIVLLLATGGWMLRTGWGFDKFSKLLASEYAWEVVSAYQERASRNRAAYLSGIAIDSAADLVWQLPIRLVFFLFAPFVWMVTSAADLIGLLDGSTYLVLVALIARRWREIRASSAAMTVLLLAFATSLIFALGTSNYGTAIRHRAKLAPLVIVVAAVAARPRQVPSGSAQARTPVPA